MLDDQLALALGLGLALGLRAVSEVAVVLQGRASADARVLERRLRRARQLRLGGEELVARVLDLLERELVEGDARVLRDLVDFVDAALEIVVREIRFEVLLVLEQRERQVAPRLLGLVLVALNALNLLELVDAQPNVVVLELVLVDEREVGIV